VRAESGGRRVAAAPRWSWSRTAVTSFAAAVLTVLAVVLTGCAASSGSTSGSSAQFVGSRWRIGDVRHGADDVRIPAALGAYVGFARDHTLSADDTVNAYFGRYRVQGNTYHPLDVGTTDVGYAGRDRARLALIGAVQALTRSDAAVTARVGGGRLRLSTAGYTVTCTDLGPARDEQPASSTATRS
jgi:hypothetical protein